MDGELDQLGERIAEQAAHLDAAMHRLLTDLREFDARGGWYVQGAATCAHWLSWRVGWDLGTARDHVRVARKLVEFALIDDALQRGEVSYSKVRAMLRVATPENEALLLDHARLMTASQLEKLCRKYALVQRVEDLPKILQWHNMLSSRVPPVTLVAMKYNMIWDGLFHVLTWTVTAIGVGLLFHAGRSGATPWSGRVLLGAMLGGWGLFNVVEGLIDHELLGVHHVHPGGAELAWDLGFLMFGALLVVIGASLARGGWRTGCAPTSHGDSAASG